MFRRKILSQSNLTLLQYFILVNYRREFNLFLSARPQNLKNVYAGQLYRPIHIKSSLKSTRKYDKSDKLLILLQNLKY